MHCSLRPVCRGEQRILEETIDETVEGFEECFLKENWRELLQPQLSGILG